ncbi:hypothetical protein MASR2M78_05080 [Treponema sp.]
MVPASSAALASLSSFLRSLASSESRLFSELAQDNSPFAAAFAESLSLAWLCNAQNPSRFASDLSLEPSLIRAALALAWKGFETVLEAEEKGLDIDAIRSADAFALLVSNETSFKKVLQALVSFRSNSPALHAYKAAERYAESRQQLAQLYLDAFKAMEGKAEGAALSSATSKLLGKASYIENASPSDAESFVQFKLMSSKLDPLSPIFVSGTLERRLVDGYAFQAAVPPAVLVEAYKDFEELVSAGLLVFSIPCCLMSRQPSSAEYALLDAGKAFYGSLAKESEAALRSIIANKCAITGVPSSFVLAFARAEDLPSRLSAFSSSSVRYLRRVNKVRDLDE